MEFYRDNGSSRVTYYKDEHSCNHICKALGLGSLEQREYDN